jgi:hypothetical protein
MYIQLEYLEETLAQVWLKARHLALICKMFEEFGTEEKAEKFGSYRYIYIYIFVYIYIYIYVLIYALIYIYIHVYIFIYLYLSIG